MKFLLQEAKGLERPGRLTLEVRATRAYIASFGTAGSLVAGAAIMFVLASAFVAFRGWPQVAGSSSPASVFVTQSKAPSAGTRAGTPATASSRRLALTLAAAAGHPGFLAGGGGVPGGGGPLFISIPGIPGAPNVFVGTPQPVPGGTGTPPSSSPSCGICSLLPPQVGSAVSGATSSAANTVAGTTTTVGSALNGAGSAVGGKVSNSGAGSAGRAVGGIVRRTGAAAGGAVSGAGKTISKLLNGH